MSQTDAQTLAQNFLASQLVSNNASGTETSDQLSALGETIKKATSITASQTTNTSTSKGYQVTLNTAYPLTLNPITSLIAGQSITLNVTSTASSSTETTNGISMYLALDRSGSMSFVTSDLNTLKSKCDNYTSEKWPYVAFTSPCYIKKIEALQTAATQLFSTLNKADTKGTMVRVGAVSYNDDTQTPSAMAWGTTAAATYVNALTATGGTDATGAMKLAYDALKSSNTTEATAQKAKGNTTFNRYILLMTDGEMTGSSASWNSSLDKQVRASCDTAKSDGIKIFTVAFMAPDRGKSLLSYCASSSDYYYEPDDMTDLVTAFGDIANKASKSAVRLTN
jgi:hypothetical protein